MRYTKEARLRLVFRSPKLLIDKLYSLEYIGIMIATNKGGVVIVLLAVVVLVGFGIWYIATQKISAPTEVTPTPTVIPTPETTIDTSDWKTYTNEELGISFKYPGDWFVSNISSSKTVIITDTNPEADAGDVGFMDKLKTSDSIKYIEVGTRDNTIVATAGGEELSYTDLINHGFETFFLPSNFSSDGLTLWRVAVENDSWDGTLFAVGDNKNSHFMAPVDYQYFQLNSQGMIVTTISDPADDIMLRILQTLR